MFEEYPKYFRYRTLRLSDPRMQGEDVYALQTAMLSLGVNPGPADGILGRLTADAIKSIQTKLKVAADGLAGGQTQTAIVREISESTRSKYLLPRLLVFGQASHESSCRLGNYSEMRIDSTYDAGVVQRNTKFTFPKEGFDVPRSIDKLGEHLRKFASKYSAIANERRRWELAAGAWNAPAYAGYIAREEGAKLATWEVARPSDTARQKLEEYMKSATAFMVL